ncbi:GL26570 [Drosophila persimilis]|uniref:GL26570 n=1 Tax=Drosophila persimilis TaxID=7234 RepID=B4GSN1_DROPE|nr:eukaryotic translation initiation factor 4 gamma [Drosophila persimilis]EDW25390.1 GL26570 [Drosophila persimilis]
MATQKERNNIRIRKLVADFRAAYDPRVKQLEADILEWQRSHGIVVERTEERAEEGAEERAEERAEKRAKERAKERATDRAKERAKDRAEERAKERPEERAKKRAEERAEEGAEERAEECAKERAEERFERRADERAKERAKQRAKERAESAKSEHKKRNGNGSGKDKEKNPAVYWQYDLKDFVRGEILLYREGNSLYLHAVYESRRRRRETKSEIVLPVNVEQSKISAKLSSCGVLTITAPLQTDIPEEMMR